MVHREIVTLAAALMLCFLLLGNFDSQFILLHLYQSLMYLVIILMLFYLEDRYAYMLGIVAPAAWLLLNYATGVLGGAARQVGQLVFAQAPGNIVSLMAAITAILSVLMIIFCAYRWRREYAGSGKGTRTFLGSLVIVVLYYAILVFWFWKSIPQATPVG